MSNLIEITNLRKVYKIGEEKIVALDDINLSIAKGEICCILGTSGSGKSTLLNMIAGLEKPSRGNILIGKNNIAKMDEKQLVKFRQKHIGFVFQSYNLLNMFTAVENVASPLVFRGIDKNVRLARSKKMLNDVGLADRINHKPNEMSGGQQQRVGIARAFVTNPTLVFADEPTGNLDSKTTQEVMELIVTLARENNLTVIIVTHDPNIAIYADRIVHIIDGNIDSDKLNNSIISKETLNNV
ncbi:MAG: ABC transporter ATP-binding protein [Oscillospiraceae bacterium]